MELPNIKSVSIIPVKRKAECLSVEEGDARVHLQEDTWSFKGEECKSVEGKLPNFLASAFEKPVSDTKNVVPHDYDRSKLSIYCISGVAGAKLAARVELVRGPESIADVLPKEDVFRIQVYPTRKGLFPMSSADFLRAIYVAKLNLFLNRYDTDEETE